jgi:hypothetical protein
MFDSPDSPAITSVLALAVALVSAVLAGIYYGEVIESGRDAALVAGSVLAFVAVVLGLFSVMSPGPGFGYAVAGIGISVAVIVLGFLAFILNLAHA